MRSPSAVLSLYKGQKISSMKSYALEVSEFVIEFRLQVLGVCGAL